MRNAPRSAAENKGIEMNPHHSLAQQIFEPRQPVTEAYVSNLALDLDADIALLMMMWRSEHFMFRGYPSLDRRNLREHLKQLNER